ncbi:MAG: carboxypeptidase regulatory-like domain-containing protein [Gemmatimonadota bacterium]
MQTMISRCSFLLLFGSGTLFLWAVPSEAQTPTATVSGQVVEEIHSTWIGGATVRLTERPVFITGSDGGFRFNGVTPGPHTLTVEAMGYRSRAFTLVIRADTILRVEMEVDPIRLDSLLVEAGKITLRGSVADGVTGRRVPEARVRAGSLYEVFTNAGGSFRIKNLPRGYSIPILVEAYKYLPARLSLITERDTTLAVELDPDSLGIRLFAAKTRELEIRTAAVPLSVLALNRHYLERSPNRSAYDVIRWRIGRDFTTSCLFIDEVKQFETRILDSYDAGEIERIEVFERGRMVRVYTQWFVATNLGTSKTFPRILFLPGGLGPDTCY